MSNVTDRLRQTLEPMSLDTHEPEPIVAVRRDELRAMLDVIGAAEHYRYISEEGWTSLANRNADQASWEDWDQERQWAFDAMVDALARVREVAGTAR